MGETTGTGPRCPQCSAAVRPGAPWCTQCYAPVGAGAGAAPARSPSAQGGVGVAERPAAVVPPPARSPVQPSPSTGCWPCGACAQPNDLAEAACTTCGAPFLAEVRERRPTLVLPGVGDLLHLSPVRRVGLAVGTVVGFLLATSLIALLLA